MNANPNKSVQVIDLGTIPYQEGWDKQTVLFQQQLQIKADNRIHNTNNPTSNYLLVCEHPHVYTLGKSGDPENLLADADLLKKLNATMVATNRGGDITYHGPGQVVVYPILDLENFFTDIHRYMRTLEEAVIETLKKYHINGGRLKGLTGVWLDGGLPGKERKICAMGVKTSRWITMHGLALNVNSDLSYFSHIVPCGIPDKAVTSMQQEVGNKVDMEGVKAELCNQLIVLFGMNRI